MSRELDIRVAAMMGWRFWRCLSRPGVVTCSYRDNLHGYDRDTVEIDAGTFRDLINDGPSSYAVRTMCPPVSTDPAAAIELWSTELNDWLFEPYGREWAGYPQHLYSDPQYAVQAATLPEAICNAYLRVKGA